MTERLYYHDSYLRNFRAQVIDLSPDGRTAYLDRTAFYPTSGGQPFDRGTLGAAPVIDVIDEGERIAHVLGEAIPQAGPVEGSIDWERRFDHMQQHTGQHLISAVFLELFDAETVSFHLGEETSTIDIVRERFTGEELRIAEDRSNEIVFQNRPVLVSYHDDVGELRLRKPSEREGKIRVVTIPDLDRSACGGTPVRSTSEIGPILLGDMEKVRGNTRLHFVCGFRALRLARARREEALSLRQRLEETSKNLRRVSIELAELRGSNAYDKGLRVVESHVSAISDDVKTEALSFTNRPDATFVALAENPPAILLAMSDGRHAGQMLKPVLTELGGRGGGNARVAQGSLPSAEAVEQAARRLIP